jgi:hypothetical protein
MGPDFALGSAVGLAIHYRAGVAVRYGGAKGTRRFGGAVVRATGVQECSERRFE